jgi:hypothetical protein
VFFVPPARRIKGKVLFVSSIPLGRFLASAAPLLEEYNSEDASIGENIQLLYFHYQDPHVPKRYNCGCLPHFPVTILSFQKDRLTGG